MSTGCAGEPTSNRSEVNQWYSETLVIQMPYSQKHQKYGHEGQTLTREIGGVKLKTMETGAHESPNTQFERANSWALEFSSQPLSRGELARRAELILGHGPKGKTGESTEWPLEDISAIEDRRANWEWRQPFAFGQTELIHGDCFDWLQQMEDNSITRGSDRPALRAGRIYGERTNQVKKRTWRHLETPAFVRWKSTKPYSTVHGLDRRPAPEAPRFLLHVGAVPAT